MPEKVKTDLGFADLQCRKSDVGRISRIAKAAYSFNRRFFGKEIKKPFHIIICYSRKEFDDIWGAETDAWLTGFATKTGTIVSFRDDLIRKYNPRKEATLAGTLRHEINHIFYFQIYGSYEPAWLLEGLTLQPPFEPFTLMENDKKRLKGPLPHLIYSTNGKTFFKQAPFLYSMAFLATRH
ncbi:Uncharacterised protein [uncultured archaeon]|nr:Uncharacterised protein [uncultured archaeon]